MSSDDNEWIMMITNRSVLKIFDLFLVHSNIPINCYINVLDHVEVSIIQLLLFLGSILIKLPEKYNMHHAGGRCRWIKRSRDFFLDSWIYGPIRELRKIQSNDNTILVLFLGQYIDFGTREVQYSPSRRRDEYCTSRVAKLSYW